MTPDPEGPHSLRAMEGSPDRGGSGPLEPLAAASPRSPSAAAGAGQPPGFGVETQAEVRRRRDVRVHVADT